MEGEAAGRIGAKGGKRNDGVCSREERKRRKTTGMVEEGVQQRPLDSSSSVSSVSHDDRSSAASGLDVADRLTYLEQRMQMQEDEIQLLKMALADVLKRLNISEEHQAAAAAAGRRAPGSKARPVSLALPSRPSVMTTSVKKSTTLPSSSSSRNYSPTPPRSNVKSPPGSAKDSPKTSKSRPSSSASTAKSVKEGSSSKTKEASTSLGTRRVTHCKVTMQIYLSPLTKKTGSSETAKHAATVPANSGPSEPAQVKPQVKEATKPESKKKSPSFTLNLEKTTTNRSTQQDPTSYKSPLKSPSQYFQICY
ncbi:uncharacterized protein ACB058_020153 isoform 2-T2 [Synchiropus picturatus]